MRTRKSKDIQNNGQKKRDKQRSTNYTHKTKDRVTQSPFEFLNRVNSPLPKFAQKMAL
jgi:hypothetical protein